MATKSNAPDFSLSLLMDLIEERKRTPRPGSYTSQLFSLGEDEILKKVGEETVEVILASKSQGINRLREEVADWLYHMLVLLAVKELTLDDILQELADRHQRSK